jgi:hypothetical protein
MGTFDRGIYALTGIGSLITLVMLHILRLVTVHCDDKLENIVPFFSLIERCIGSFQAIEIPVLSEHTFM